MLKKILLLFCFLCGSLYAEHPIGLLTFGGGVLRPNDPRPCFFIEYKDVLPKWTRIRPQIGAMTENFHSLYVYAGLGIDLVFFNRFVITPSFCPGLYFREPPAVRLWFPIEFRSCIELAWIVCNKARIGISYFHLSNASLSRHNPGVNIAAFFVSFPFGWKKYSCCLH